MTQSDTKFERHIKSGQVQLALALAARRVVERVRFGPRRIGGRLIATQPKKCLDQPLIELGRPAHVIGRLTALYEPSPERGLLNRILKAHRLLAQASEVSQELPGAAQTLAAGTADGLILWDVPSGLLLARLRCVKGPVRDLAFTADSRGVFTSHSRAVIESHIDSARLMRRLAPMAGRGLTRDEWRQYLPGYPYEDIPRHLAADPPHEH